MAPSKRGKEREEAPRRGAQAEDAWEQLKEEVAQEVGVPAEGYGGDVPAKKWGALGGHMVRRLVKKGEASLDEEEDEEPGSSRRPRGGR